MRILYLLSNEAHAHDYGVDFLYDGLCKVLGGQNVIDWPEKHTLHLAPNQPLDECRYDSDQRWPKRGRPLWDYVPLVDLVVIAIQPGVGKVAEETAGVCYMLPKHLPIVAVDLSDDVSFTAGFYTQVATRALAAYFKRELPLTAHWGLPLPLCYPADRAPDPLPPKSPTVFYVAESHGTNSPGIPRSMIAEQIAKLVPEEARRVRLYHGLGQRMHPDAYHAEMAKHLIGVSWNGVHNYDGNRTWEQFAYGLAQVIETPRTRIPHAPRHMEHCLYASRVEEVAPMVAELVRQPELAVQIAANGHRHFLAHHSSEARARYFLEMIERVG